MERKQFIQTCGMACIGGVMIPALLPGCVSSRMIDGIIEGSDLIVPLDDFVINKNGRDTYRQYIVVMNKSLQYPVCVYRLPDTYTALWMRCTHQGTELRAFGDRLLCPAHGSEFSNLGEVQNGPADEPLRVFPVTIQNDHLRISLK